MDIQGKHKEAVINLVTSFNEVGWRGERLNMLPKSSPEDDKGSEKTVMMLDVAVKYDSKVEAPRSPEQSFYNLGPKPDQTLLSYIADHREHQGKNEKHGIKVSDDISG